MDPNKLLDIKRTVQRCQDSLLESIIDRDSPIKPQELEEIAQIYLTLDQLDDAISTEVRGRFTKGS